MPLIIQAKVVSDHGSNHVVARRLAGVALKLLSQNNVKLNVEAAIKRVLFELEKESKDGNYNLLTVLKEIKQLTASFDENMIMSSLRHMC